MNFLKVSHDLKLLQTLGLDDPWKSLPAELFYHKLHSYSWHGWVIQWLRSLEQSVHSAGDVWTPLMPATKLAENLSVHCILIIQHEQRVWELRWWGFQVQLLLVVSLTCLHRVYNGCRYRLFSTHCQFRQKALNLGSSMLEFLCPGFADWSIWLARVSSDSVCLPCYQNCLCTYLEKRPGWAWYSLWQFLSESLN